MRGREDIIEVALRIVSRRSSVNRCRQSSVESAPGGCGAANVNVCIATQSKVVDLVIRRRLITQKDKLVKFNLVVHR